MDKRDISVRLLTLAQSASGEELQRETRKWLNKVSGPSNQIIYDEDQRLVTHYNWHCMILGCVESDADKLMANNTQLINAGRPDLCAVSYGRAELVFEEEALATDEETFEDFGHVDGSL